MLLTSTHGRSDLKRQRGETSERDDPPSTPPLPASRSGNRVVIGVEAAPPVSSSPKQNASRVLRSSGCLASDASRMGSSLRNRSCASCAEMPGWKNAGGLSCRTVAFSTFHSSRSHSRIADVTQMCLCAPAQATRSYRFARRTRKCFSPSLRPISVYAKLCQSMMNVAPRRKDTSRHTVNDGAHGGVCRSTKRGRGSRMSISASSCRSCVATRTARARTRGRHLPSHAGGGAMSRRWMCGWVTISSRGVEPVYATTSTSNDAWSASESAWYCMRGERPKSPSTTTCTRRRGPAGARDDPRRRDAAMMNRAGASAPRCPTSFGVSIRGRTSTTRGYLFFADGDCDTPIDPVFRGSAVRARHYVPLTYNRHALEEPKNPHTSNVRTRPAARVRSPVDPAAADGARLANIPKKLKNVRRRRSRSDLARRAGGRDGRHSLHHPAERPPGSRRHFHRRRERL